VPEKGVADAIRAFAVARRVLPSAFLEVRGDGPDRERQRAYDLRENLKLHDVVRLAGPLPTDEEKWRLFGNSMALLAPSYMEHFGLAVREALSMGLPTVAYDLPSFDDIREHPALRLAPLGDITALADALKSTLLLGASERRALAEAANSLSVGPTWDEAVEEEEKILLSLARHETELEGVANSQSVSRL
jgi:glycosyltransferase involved in cell wall biosynthesis